MKKILASVVGAMTMLSCFVGQSQGTIEFSNYHPSAGVNAPVYQSDGVTRLSGPQFQAELLAGASPSGLALIATAPFYDGSNAGYIQGSYQSVPGVAGGYTAWVEVQVWNTASGATFAQAQASGLPDSWWESSIFSLVTGGGGVTPTPPAPLTGLGNSAVFLNSVPEPSAFILFGLGALGTLVPWRRLPRG